MKRKIVGPLLVFLLAGLAVFSPRAAEAQQTRSTVSYLIGIPSSDTKDFISTMSYLGGELDLGFVPQHGKFESSLILGFQRFKKTESGSSYTNPDNGLTVTGDQERSLDMYPILYKLRYWPNGPSKMGELNWFVSGGAGFAYVERRFYVGSFNFSKYGSQIVLRPEAGLSFQLSNQSAVEATVRYDYGIATSNLPTLGATSIGIGYSYYY